MLIYERKLFVSNSRVGPAHDPYSRQFVTMRLNGDDVTFVGCSLAGDGIQFNDGSIVWDFDTHEGNAARCFKELTGLYPCQAERYYFTKTYEPDPMGPASMYV